MSRRGATVIELLVAATLLMVVLAVLLLLGRPILRSWVHSDKRAHVQSQPALVVARMREEIRSAEPESVVVLDSPIPAVLFLSCLDETGKMAYDQHGELKVCRRVAIYYRRDLREVRCQTSRDLDLTGPPVDEPMTAPAVDVMRRTDWLNSMLPQARRLGSDIERFELGHAEGQAVSVVVEALKNNERSLIDTSILPMLAAPPGVAGERRTYGSP